MEGVFWIYNEAGWPDEVHARAPLPSGARPVGEVAAAGRLVVRDVSATIIVLEASRSAH